MVIWVEMYTRNENDKSYDLPEIILADEWHVPKETEDAETVSILIFFMSERLFSEINNPFFKNLLLERFCKLSCYRGEVRR